MSKAVATYDPIATEYKGVVYRSKCEAMFARWLELKGSDFYYEPQSFIFGDWCFDFITLETETPGRHNHDGNFFFMPTCYCEIIEYKPKKPTGTYIDSFMEKANRLDSYDFFKGAFSHCNYVIYYGSVFNKDRGLIWWQPDGTHVRIECDWLYSYEDDIKATRFDLEAN